MMISVQSLLVHITVQHEEHLLTYFSVEHEISGDVLLDLDINMLKELEIHALGKRMKIAHAIKDLKTDLKQPLSAVSSTPSAHYVQGQSPLQHSSSYGHSTRSHSITMYSPESALYTTDFPQYALPMSASVPVYAGPAGMALTNELEGIPVNGRPIGLGVLPGEAIRVSSYPQPIIVHPD